MTVPSPNPIVSVVIPCYNAAPYLRETIDSVLRQTVPPLEVLVIDDGSTDDSAAIAESYGPPVRVIRQANQGACVARNRGHDEARGEWVAFLDADDLWEPTMSEAHLRAVGPDVIASHTNYYNFGRVNNRNEHPIAPPGDDPYTATNIILRSPFNMSSLMVRRTVPVRSRPGYKNTEEMMYCTELARAGRIVYIDAPLTGYRRHGASLTGGSGFGIHWHRTVWQWLAENPLGLSSDELVTIRQGMSGRLIEEARQAQWRRDWGTDHAIREYLAAFRDDPQVAEYLGRRPWPRWVYSLKDRLARSVLVSRSAPA